MTDRLMPRYPIYIPSKGRADVVLTTKWLERDGVPFRMVVEDQEHDEYAAVVGADQVLVLPFSNLGSVIPARNWIKEHATAEGHYRHWQLDDNMRQVHRWYKGKRIPCRSGVAFRVVEDFADRYTNVAIAGMNYEMFGIGVQPPFHLNCHVYSCSLILNELSHQWRGVYNEDTDLCLQVLSDGWCTVLVNAFLVNKEATMKVGGGNTKEIYQGDGRLRMARELERLWPGVVETKRRFGRPQHVVKDAWRKFDTPLQLREGLDLEQLAQQGTNEYGMQITEVKPVKSPALRKLAEEYRETHGESSENRP